MVRQPRRPTSRDCQPPRRYADDRCRESAAGAGGGQVLGFQAFSHRDVAVGADAETQVLALPREHPLLGLRKCAVVDCQAGVRTPNTDLRKLCVERFKVSGIPIETFTAAQCGKSAKGEQWCRIRAVSGSRICGYGCVTTTTASGVVSRSRNSLRCRHVRPFGSLGPCRVASCTRSAAGQGLCQRPGTATSIGAGKRVHRH
jgi:hypothetical protein